MQLNDVISILGPTNTNEDLLVILTSTVTLASDHTLYTWSYVSNALLRAGLTPQQVDDFINGLSSVPGGTAISKSLDSGGVDFALDSIQLSLTSIQPIVASVFGDAGNIILNVLKSIGIPTAPKWQTMGLSNEPSLDDIAAAKTQLDVIAWASGLYNNAMAVSATMDQWKNYLQSQYLSKMPVEGISQADILSAINADDTANGTAIDGLIAQLTALKASF